MVAVAGSEGGILLLGVPGFQHLGNIHAHSGGVTTLASLSGNRLASGGADHRVCIWDIASKSVIRVLTGHHQAVSSSVWAPAAPRLYTGDRWGSIIAWDIANYKLAGYLFDPFSRRRP